MIIYRKRKLFVKKGDVMKQRKRFNIKYLYVFFIIFAVMTGWRSQQPVHSYAAQNTAAVISVTLITNCQGTANQKLTRTSGEAYGALPDLKQTNYTFLGWYTKIAGGDRIQNSTIISATSDITLYAHWKGAESTITFSPMGGSLSSSATRKAYYGQLLGSLPVPVRTGYRFDGWTTAAGALIEEVSTVRWLDNQTFYAAWKILSPKITFDANGGSLTYQGATVEKYSSEITYGTAFTALLTPEKEGFQFNGWYTALSEGTKIENGTLNTFEKDTVLYADWIAKTYTVSFYAMGGTVSFASKSVVYLEDYGTLPVPVRDNYVFTGWYLEAEGKTKITASGTVKTDSNHILYAGWAGKDVTVQFDAAGGSCATKSKTVQYQGNYGTLPTAKRTGYTFLGWYTLAGSSTQITKNSVETQSADHTLYAHWEVITPIVTFDANEGTVQVTSKTVEYQKAYGELPVPVRSGYDFNGWFLSKNGSKQVLAADLVKSAENITLYAHWTGKQYTVSFDGNGGTTSTGSQSVTYGSKYGTLPSVSRTGYVFSGWYTSKTAGVKVEAGSLVQTAANQTLYAMWGESSYTVSFHTTLGAVIPAKLTVFSTQSYSDLPIPVCEGYIFTGWYTKESNGGSKVTSVTKEASLYARWTGEIFTISLNANGGSLTNTVYAVTNGAKFGVMPSPTRVNYTFDGWYTKADGGSMIKESTAVEGKSIQMLYAHWKPAVYTLTYNANGGPAISSGKKVSYGEKYGALKEVSRSGYVFTGWFTLASGGSLITSDTIVSVSGNQTIYAQWEVKQPDIKFMANGGAFYLDTGKKTYLVMAKVYGAAYGVLPEPVKEGYDFQGWFTTKSGSVKITSVSTCNVKDSQTLYAHWKAKTITISFDTNGGSQDKTSISVNYGQKLGTLPEPKRSGYTFKGWYTEDSGKTKLTANSTNKSAVNFTLYAKWEVNSYKITLNGNGGKNTDTSNSGKIKTAENKTVIVYAGSTYADIFAESTGFTKDGYVFLGWFTAAAGGSQVTIDMNFTVNSAQTLYAHWQKK